MEGERGKLALGWRICGNRDLIGEREERFKVDLFFGCARIWDLLFKTYVVRRG